MQDNPVAALVAQAGLTLAPTDFNDSLARNYLDGLPSPGADRASTELTEILDVLGEEELAAAPSVAAVLAAEGWRADTPDRRFAAAAEIVQDYGLDLDRLGAQALSEGQDYVGGDALVVGGFVKVPELLATGVDVRLNTSVESVSATGSAVELNTSAGLLGADAAVVAVPLALLQQARPRVDLPPAAVAAMGSLATGNLEKVFCEFPTRWWPPAQVLQIVNSPEQRWTEWYDLTALTSRPVLVGLSGGAAATSRPPEDQACAAEAEGVLQSAFR